MICTVEALVFSPLPARQHINCLSLLFLYINEVSINFGFVNIKLLITFFRMNILLNTHFMS